VITIFRDKSIVAIFALVIVGLLIHLHVFLVPVQLNAGSNSGLLSWLFQHYLTKLKPIFINVVYILLLLTQAVRLNIILNNNKMFGKASFTTALAFMILSGLFTNAYTFCPALVAASLVIWLFHNAMKLYNNAAAKILIFNIGFVASASVILYQPMLFVTITMLFAIAILRPFKTTEWLSFIIGIITPIYLLMAGLYLFDTLPLLQKFIPQIHFKIVINVNPWYWMNVSTITLMAIAGLIVWYPNSSRMVIQIRKNWILMLILFILLISSILLFNSSKYLPEILSIIPLAAFVANFFLYPQRTIFINLILILAVIMIVYNNVQLLE
jgi:hypothetical protein